MNEASSLSIFPTFPINNLTIYSYGLLFQNLFDLKTEENEKLQENLTDTIEQLEAKSAILFKTQEEKEVQEHLVSRHKDTEDKIRNQAFELREVADQQYSDLDKLHASKDRKRWVFLHGDKSMFQYVPFLLGKDALVPGKVHFWDKVH